MPRRLSLILLFALVLTPFLASMPASNVSFAQEEATVEASPEAEATPETETTPEGEVTPETDPTTVPDPTEVPTEEPAASPTAEPVVTEEATPESPVVDAGIEASPSATPPVGSVDDLTITLRCTTPAETIRITNNGVADIDLQSLTTLVDLISDEPFALTRTLRPGQTAIFQAGRDAQYGTVLTTRYILTNSAWENEGVTFGTSVGEVTKRCDPKPPPPPPPAGKTSDLAITLKCGAYAETIRVTNNGSGWITLNSIGTLYDPISGEPFTVDRTLRPGASALFSAGAGAQYGTILTTNYIFTNSVYERDGVRIGTNVGTVTKACDKKPAPPEHWVEVDLSMQYLWAWEGNKLVNQTYVSTGKAGFETPTGTFYILVKYRYDDMAGCIQGECYNVPAVPWTMYFTNYGHALHGAYWHNQFGTPRSHGCVNLPLWFAEWLFTWLPYGGRVVVHW